MARASLLRDLPPAFGWLFAGILVNRIGTFVAPFLVLYLTQERGLSPALAGAALATWGLGALAATPLAGWAADRFGRRVTLLACMFGAAGALALLGAARAPWLILLAALLTGGTADGFRPASSAIVADMTTPEQRPRAFALTFWATNLGFCLAALTGGALASAGWWLLFAVDAATCAVFGVLIWSRIPETRPDRVAGDPPGSFAQVVRDRLLLAVAALFLIQGILLFQAFSTLPLSMDADGHSPAVYGAVIALNGVVIIVLQPFIAAPLAAMPRARVLGVALLLMGGGLWATALAEQPFEFALTVALWTLGEVGFAAVAMAVVADLAPPHLRGRYTSVSVAAGSIAFTVAPLAGTALFEAAGEGAVWGACGALGATGLMTALAIDGPLRRRLSPGSPRPA